MQIDLCFDMFILRGVYLLVWKYIYQTFDHPKNERICIRIACVERQLSSELRFSHLPTAGISTNVLRPKKKRTKSKSTNIRHVCDVEGTKKSTTKFNNAYSLYAEWMHVNFFFCEIRENLAKTKIWFMQRKQAIEQINKCRTYLLMFISVSRKNVHFFGELIVGCQTAQFEGSGTNVYSRAKNQRKGVERQ